MTYFKRKSITEHLFFLQLGQMPEDESNLIKLHELHAYIDQANKKAIPKREIC